MGLSLYDALLDSYDPGLRQAAIDPLFAELRDLIREARERQESCPAIQPLDGPSPIDDQRRVGEQLMKALGFDFNRGRLDVSRHPFCGGSTGDVRITTCYSEANFMSALMGGCMRLVTRSMSRAARKRGAASRSSCRKA